MPRDNADHANTMLIRAAQYPQGSLQRSEALLESQIYATLSLRDAVLEWVSALRHVSRERAERNGAG